MPERGKLVIDTGPVIALVAALGDLGILEYLYHEVIVPFEVCREISLEGAGRFAARQFQEAAWLTRRTQPTEIAPYLLKLLDLGEASAIQLALKDKIDTVCIDESAGRRVARIHNLSLTDSIGILLRAKREGRLPSVRQALGSMKSKGIWLSERVIEFALRHAGEADG